jgi:xanthine dehydrogenase small subunit
MRDHVCFFLNGEKRIVRGSDVFSTVSDYLRGRLAQTGTKVVCAEGDCGACTILVGRCRQGKIVYEPIDSCIQFMHQIDGAHAVTIEGLGQGGLLHPAQQALVDHHGSQCGYCTPGMAMALAGWAEAGCPVDREAPRLALTGNLCRCTGYQSIFAAADALAQAPPERLTERYASAPVYDDLLALSREPLEVCEGGRQYFAPTTLAEAVAFKAVQPGAVIVAGATELGVWRNKRGFEPPALLSLARIAELDGIAANESSITFGANVTWARIANVVAGPLPELHGIIRRFGSPQIRNIGTLAGNIANGSPIADSLGLLSVLDASLELVSQRGGRTRSINGFYTGYKKKDLANDELIARVTIPLPSPQARLRLTKVSRRHDLDIASFGAAILIEEAGGMIAKAAVALLGVAATVVRATETEAFLRGRPFNETTFRRAGRIARSEIQPIDDVRGSRDFRLRLAENVLAKFFFDETAMDLEA